MTSLSPETTLKYAKKYLELQKKGSEARKRYYIKNKDTIAVKQKEKYQQNPEKYRQRYKDYYTANKQKKKAYYEKSKAIILTKKRARDRAARAAA